MELYKSKNNTSLVFAVIRYFCFGFYLHITNV